MNFVAAEIALRLDPQSLGEVSMIHIPGHINM